MSKNVHSKIVMPTVQDGLLAQESLENEDVIDALDTGDANDSEEFQYLNDAEILGDDNEEMQDLLCRNATFMKGDMYGQGDRRNTRDGDWKAVTMTWGDWLDKGFSNHVASKHKEGASVVFAEALGGARKDSAIATMQAICLDIDSGPTLGSVIDTLLDKDIFAFVYTSYNDGKEVIELKHDDIIRKLDLKVPLTRIHVQEYLRAHHKDRYDESFIDQIEVTDARKQTADGLRTIVKTPPLEKFRVIVPLWEPVELKRLALSLAQYKDKWADAVTGFAVNTLGVTFDATCCDVNRLFFTPRHPKGTDAYCAVIRGRPLRFEDIAPHSKNAYLHNRDDNAFTAGTEEVVERETFLTPAGRKLNDWHSTNKERFLVVDVLEDHCQDKLRVAGGERIGTCHIECPFEHEHSSTGGTGTMARNPDETEHGYWTVFCRHDACASRNKLEFIKEMLDQNWFEESVLDDDAYYLAAEDSELEDEPQPDDPLLVAATFGDNSDAEMLVHLTKWAKNGADMSMQSAITEVIVKHTKLGKREVNKLWKQAKKEKRRKKHGVLNIDSGFEFLVSETKRVLNTANEADPFLFGYLEQPVELRSRPDGSVTVKALTYDGLSEVITREVKYEKSTGGETVSTAPPYDVVKNIHHQSLDKYTLPLRVIATTPFFDSGGALVSNPGYHEGSKTYLALPPGFEVPRVSARPTDDELDQCRKHFLEVFGDFPFDGLPREDIENGKSASYANTVGMVVLPFMRDMIDGPTPGHLVNKPAPGTGAGLLLDVTSLIWTGKNATMMTIPKRKEEIGKTIIAKLRSGASYLCFDNIPDNLDSDDLAMALAQGVIDARVLGKNDASAVDEIEVRVTWLITGNNVNMSDELIRRMTLIALDARMARPETRGGWRHANLKRWVLENRPRIVWACLTLIQNWIAKGREPLAGDLRKGGFDEWLESIGGVLRDAGIEGFYTNEAELREVATDAEEDGLETLASTLSEYSPGQTFYVTGKLEPTIMGILNNGPKDLDPVPILINGWDYVDGIYSNPQRVGRRFENFAKKPRLARRQAGSGFVTVEIGFDVGYDSHRKCNFYCLKMRAPGSSKWITDPDGSDFKSLCG
ncbi:hypothetical protein EF888_06525 [Silicimonas algicola]|uniref:Uncharacterized protein n=1 Tax=Silicimonas algicola TaxID=1826607 RepID=A0A316G2V2_9RHOB|nr:hypothetical protein [Silicimonas algicola]AZQ66824.1 hypothetical protein EF888_06525 [Silicimonas algicola]PWK55271.1 hypothetical protein C8D95_108150 [Silicimonas algicola]